MCGECMSAALAAYTVYPLSATETPLSSSSDFGDSKYDDPEAAAARLRELEQPEVTLAVARLSGLSQ